MNFLTASRKLFLTTAAALLLAAGVFLPVPAGAFGTVPYVTQAQFSDQVLNAPGPVLVQFDATWCPYCRKLQPLMQELYQTGGGMGLTVVRVDADSERALLDLFNVRSLPTMSVMYRGREVGRHQGGASRAKLYDWLKDVQVEIDRHSAAAAEDDDTL